MLNPNGTLYSSNLRGAYAVDIYYLSGVVVVTLEPHFYIPDAGFRYMSRWTGLEMPKPALEAVTGIAVHSAMERRRVNSSARARW